LTLQTFKWGKGESSDDCIKLAKKVQMWRVNTIL